MNIPALEANVEELERRIKRLQFEIEATELELQLTRNDIAAARLQAWYRDNPGVELTVGDQLELTEEFRENRRFYGGLWLYEANGVAVESIYLNFDDELTVRINPNDPGSCTSIPFDMAFRMRQAWLAQEAKS